MTEWITEWNGQYEWQGLLLLCLAGITGSAGILGSSLFWNVPASQITGTMLTIAFVTTLGIWRLNGGHVLVKRAISEEELRR